MVNEITTTTQGIAKDEKTGLTLPLSGSLTLQDLAKHRAMVAVELEVLAKKYDRYGWERDRGSAAHDRIITDWMNALQDYPLDEVRKACAEAVKDDPKRMPNEGAVLKQILKARQKHVQALPKPRENVAPINRPTAQRAAEIIRAAGIQLRGTPQ